MAAGPFDRQTIEQRWQAQQVTIYAIGLLGGYLRRPTLEVPEDDSADLADYQTAMANALVTVNRIPSQA